MSYDIYFKKDDKVCQLPFKPPIGGTYCLNEEYREAHLNMTCNYAGTLHRVGLAMVHHDNDKPGTKTLNGMTAQQVVDALAKAIPKLADDVDHDYWKETDGNVKAALTNLLTIAVNVPSDSICEVDY